jgi:hypothetical protein
VDVALSLFTTVPAAHPTPSPCTTRRAPHAELGSGLEGVRTELAALKKTAATEDQLTHVLHNTQLLTESLESLAASAATAAELERVAAEVQELGAVTSDEQRQVLARLEELQQRLTAEQETREINRCASSPDLTVMGLMRISGFIRVGDELVSPFRHARPNPLTRSIVAARAEGYTYAANV